MNRMTDSDRNFGPFTWGRWKNRISLMWTGGDEEDGPRESYITAVAFGWGLRLRVPKILQPLRIRHEANWDKATIERLGRNHYFETYEREYGISLSNMGNGYDFLQVHFGPQTHDGRTTKDWCKHLPWMQQDCVRHSLYEPDGKHFYTEPHWKIRLKLPDRAQFEFYEKKEKCPACYFGFEDFDGEMIVVICKIEELEWHKGTGWFTWLKYFTKPMIRRSLDLEFTKEVGPEKGSWKGGTIGHSIDMLPGETPEDAFRRYCGTPRDARHGRKYGIRFIGPCTPPPPKGIRVAMARGWREVESQKWHHPDSQLCKYGHWISTAEMLEAIQEENREHNNQCKQNLAIN